MIDPRDEAPRVPGEWGVDSDPYTDEDGIGDDMDQPLPEITEDIPEDVE